jgi:type IV secretory pathway TrbL component
MFSNLTDLAAFLKFGPLGLAGLLLVLMATALTLKLNETRERLILRILYVGAFCYVVASVSAYASLHYDSDANRTADLYKARDASQMSALGSAAAFTDHYRGIKKAQCADWGWLGVSGRSSRAAHASWG